MTGASPQAAQPFLRLNFATLWVRDQERSKRFFVDRAGFEVVVDMDVAGHGRWVVVAPPSAILTDSGGAVVGLALVVPPRESNEEKRIGQNTGLGFLTEDLRDLYASWSQRGVCFSVVPEEPAWASGEAKLAVFEDVDGNSFSLIEFDSATREMESGRRARLARMQAEREAAHEAAIAREVQRRLLPQRRPELRTLEYAGVCLPARAVGGDYYDFLDFGPGRTGFVIGDIAGKGMAAALLMANLQASLRGQSATAWERPAEFLTSVNQQFYASTTQSGYTTLLYGAYDDASRSLRYANGGHPPGLLVRQDGSIERLEPTGTVIGLFEKWDCTIEQVQLHAGDTLLLYTDGASEAATTEGEEFGDARLAELLRENSDLPADRLLEAIADAIRRFSPGEQADDITLIALRCV